MNMVCSIKHFNPKPLGKCILEISPYISLHATTAFILDSIYLMTSCLLHYALHCISMHEDKSLLTASVSW